MHQLEPRTSRVFYTVNTIANSHPGELANLARNLFS
jgi:hypothetical protein